MNQINLVNNEEEKADIVLFPSFFSFDFIQKERNSTPASQLKDDKLINIENIKNIFEEETLDLNEHVEEDNEKSLYFIKKQDNLDTESRSTENSSNFSLDQDKYSNTKKGDSFKKIINFRTFLKKKRGKKPILNNKKVSKKPHSSDDFDNIQRKIQVHFLNFVISFCNDALKYYFKNSYFSFKKMNQKEKINVNFKYVSKLKKSSIKDLLKSEISNKFKTFDKNENKILLSQLKETWLDKLFEMNYLELFKHYYNDNKESPLDSIFFENKKIPLSKDTKSFSHLLKKNESTKEYIVEVTKSIYFCDNENDGTLFSTKTFP